jgi:uncharacterized membrane protein
MNALLWTLQIVLAVAFGISGTMKLTQHKERLADQMGWVDDFSPTTVKLIGALELLGAIGLVLPAATDTLEWLTPLAALGLLALMVLAIPVHLRRHEASMVAVNVVVALLAGFIAWQRFGPHAF